MGRMLTGNKSVEDIWSTRYAFCAVGPIKESMPADAFQDLCQSMHFADDWEQEDKGWNEIYTDGKEEPAEGTARHHRKFGAVIDAYMRFG